MTLSRSANTTGALYSLLAFAIYSSHDVVVKYLGASFSPFQIVFFSTLFGFPVVTMMMIRDTTDGNLRPRFPVWTAARTVAILITAICVFYAFSVLPLAETYAILFAMPLLITLLSIPMLGERVGWQRGLAVIVGLGGVLVVLQPGASAFSLGHGAALLGAVTGSLASIIVRKVGNEERDIVLLLYPMMANFLVLGVVLPFVYVPMEVAHVGGLFVMAVFGFAAMLFQIIAYRQASAVIVAPMQYSQIIWAAIFGALLFDEQLATTTIIGAVIIIASGVFIVLREDRKDDSETPVLASRSRYVQGTLPRLGAVMRMLRLHRNQPK